MSQFSNFMRLSREPLIIFFLIGLALFFINAVNGSGDDAGSSELRVTSAQIAQLSAAWEGQNRRPPTPQELNGLIQSHITEEILVREAIALGLDQDDTIVRRRLAQKARFLLEDNIEIPPPDDDDLRTFFESNEKAYVIPALFTFDHVYFSDSGADRELSERIETAKAALGQTPSADWKKLGDAFMLSRTIVNQPLSSIGRTFGSEFSAQLPDIEVGPWVGPVRSGLGTHLIRIREKTDARLPAFAELKGLLARDYVNQVRREENAKRMDELRGQYSIVIDIEDAQE